MLQNSTCFNQSLCSTTKFCSNVPGCLVPDSDYLYYEEQNITLYCEYTPRGCLLHYISKDQCDLFDVEWIPNLPTSECLSWASICQDFSITNPSMKNSGTSGPPLGWNFRNLSECNACSGNTTSYFDSVPGKWMSGTWRTLSWVPKKAVPGKWAKDISLALLSHLIDNAIALEVSREVVESLLCDSFSFVKSLYLWSCNCGEIDRYFGSCYSNITVPITLVAGGLTMCTNVDENFNNVYLNHTAQNLVIFDEICVSVDYTSVPSEQFTLTTVIFEGRQIFSFTKQKTGQKLYVTNVNGVVVGQMISDGIGLQTPTPIKTSGSLMCVKIRNQIDFLLSEVPTYLDLISSQDLVNFHLMNLKLSTDENQACFNYTGENGYYIPVWLVGDYENVQIRNTWTSAELGLMIFLEIGYFFSMCWVFYSLVMRLIEWKIHKTKHLVISPLFDLAKMALTLLLILCLFRIAYFIVLPLGMVDSVVTVNTFISEFSSLLYMSVVTLTACKWGELYFIARSFGKKTHMMDLVTLVILVSLGIIFVCCFSVFASLEEGMISVDCATTQEERQKLTTSTKVAIVYMSIFATYCVMVGMVMAIFGTLVTKLMSSQGESTPVEERKHRHKMQRFMMVTLVCTLSMLVQAIFLLISIDLNLAHNISNVDKLVVIFITEWIPTQGLILLFRYKSGFLKTQQSSGISNKIKNFFNKTPSTQDSSH
eukprot:TRINITY_DN14016_c0_g1_i2.p1 TRINITY_DN14016_c0_g1~~TRINITY_DN14016_c0_g1_i2.p1  ORF type:complete len:708 (-),score=110.50 TRINITY_DN14016_c0_g1_i2:235-2358(-)